MAFAKRGAETSIYIGLRLFNTALAILWGFALMAILIRALGIEAYGYYVIIGAIGMYIASTDLGVSNVLYAKLRAAFLKGDIAALIAPARGAIMLYWLIAALATFGYAAWASVGKAAADHAWAALFLFFLLTISNFPWIVVRATVTAVDRHVAFELIDAARRSGQFAALLLVSINAELAFALINLLWLIAYCLAALNIRAAGITGFTVAPWRIRDDMVSFWHAFGPLVAHSAIFVLCEAAIYNFPYLIIPLLYGPGYELVVFDVFYKFLRAAISCNQVFSMGLLPQITRHHYAHNKKELLAALRTVLVLSLFAMIAMNLLIAAYRWEIFTTLLHDRASLVTSMTLAAIAVASAGNAVQNTFGSYVVNIGKVGLARSLSLMIATAFVMLIFVASITKLPFDVFLFSYACTYFLGALAWAVKGLAIGASKDTTSLRRRGSG